MEKYNIEYSCGCIHELTNNKGMHEATGNNKNCDIHKEVK